MTATRTTRKTSTAAAAADATAAPRAADDTLDTLDTLDHVDTVDATPVFIDMHIDAVDAARMTDLDAVDLYRASLDTFDVAAKSGEESTVNLKASTLSRYAHHAARFARTVDAQDPNSTRVILSDDIKRVSTAVWVDAGLSGTPDKETRESRAAYLAISSYVSRFARVAKNGAYGVDVLTDSKSADSALKEISESESDAKKAAATKEEDTVRDAALAAFDRWRKDEDTPANVKRALDLIERTFVKTPAAVHFPAYVLDLNAKVSGKPRAPKAPAADVINGAPTF